MCIFAVLMVDAAVAVQPGQQKSQCVIPVLQQAASPGGFPGLYAFSIPEQGFVDAKTLLITSQWYSQTVVLQVDLGSGSVTPVTPTDPSQGSWTLQVKRLKETQSKGNAAMTND
jgi:hypothetical protein